MKLSLSICFLIFFLVSFNGYAIISVTSPNADDTLKSAKDYAALTFQDPWDMDERTDLGWFIFNIIDNPKSNLDSISFSGGIFSADSTSNDPNIFILDTGILNSAYLGKIGSNYPIDGSTYKVLAFRMKLDNPSSGQILWSTNTIYNGVNTSNGFFTYPGWNIYFVNIEDLGTAAGDPWGGSIDSLRLDPTALTGENIQIDWIRLVNVDVSLNKNITWTGNLGNVDIYLDNDNNFGNGYLGRIAQNVSGVSYTLYAGALSPGDYYVGVCETGDTSSIQYSAGSYSINDIPTFNFLNPSDEGSADDFATVQLNDKWDMDSLDDIDRYNNLSQISLQTITTEDEAGKISYNVDVLKGRNTTNNRDPVLYPLWWNDRGFTYNIDTDRYRILTFKMGLNGNRDIQNGSIARIVWRVKGETLENVSQDIVLRHKTGITVLNNISVDMDSLLRESGAGLSGTGWNGTVDGFRVDPHEFLGARDFYIEKIKLSALEKINTSYTISWEYGDSDAGTLSMSLFYDNDNTDYDGTSIVSDIDPSTGSYLWDSSLVPAGEYYIYATISDGSNANKVYSKWPIVVDHSYNPDQPNIQLSREKIYFGVTNSGNSITGPQKVLVNVDNDENIAWTVTSNRSFILVDNPSGSGDGQFSISVDNLNYTPGSYDGTITVQSSSAGNSPQYVRVFMEAYAPGSSNAPFGSFSTPVNGSTVRSSIPVTGWVLDDIEVESVKIYRELDSDLVYIGDAVFVEGARPDVEAVYSTYPFNYRAGWGYMLLTYGLPNRGMNDTFTIHAIATDKEGNEVDLGTKVIHCDNQNAVKPFGALDWPKQGGEASGNAYLNWGWALTPQPNMIPIDGSTISVVVDGVVIGNPAYDLYRADIATRYPGYLNTDGAVGLFYLDTTAYENGVHTISWRVSDNGGNSDGIGSRFFNIVNTSSSSTSLSRSNSKKQKYIKKTENITALDSFLEDTSEIRFYNKFKYNTEFYPIKYNSEQREFEVIIEELNLVNIRFFLNHNLSNTSGYLIVGEDLHPLPIGSTMDREKGIFYWDPGPGFVGEYNFLFMNYKNNLYKKIKILIKPKSYN